MGVQIFIPCYCDQAAPTLAQALTRLLDYWQVAWTYPRHQTCCGQFAFNAGDLAGARRLMHHFLTVFSGDQLIICPSASCVLTVRNHYPSLASNPAASRQVARLQTRLRELSEWLSLYPPLSLPLPAPLRLLVHHSCAARQLEILSLPPRVLSGLSNLTLLPPPPHYSCCGFGGLFAFSRPGLSTAMGLAYLQAVLETGAQGVVSTDYSCLMHLQGIIRKHSLPLQGYHLVELLAAALPASGTLPRS